MNLNIMKISVITLCSIMIISSCNYKLPLVKKSDFATKIDNSKVELINIRNNNGLTMQVTNFGARIVKLFVPDKNGKFVNIVAGHETLQLYVHPNGERFLGASIGRYGNRIAKGTFSLNGQKYNLSTYNKGQCLHGGIKGFDMKVWTIDNITKNSISLSLISPDMEEGFPGTLKVNMKYTLTDNNEFKITYKATTDKSTVINLTNHSFFNLEGKGTILNQELCINANSYTPIDSVSIPTGEIRNVSNTPFDFSQPHKIEKYINSKNEQIQIAGGGYDHNFILNRKKNKDLEFAASLYDKESGRYMEVWTTEPALQFYSGNFFDGTKISNNGNKLVQYSYLALETQHYPDSPNRPEFPSTVLNPGEIYSHICIYKFSIK